MDGNDGHLVVIHYSGDADEARRLLAQAIKDNPQLVYLLLPGKGCNDVHQVANLPATKTQHEG